MNRAIPAIGLTIMGTALVLRFQTAPPELASAEPITTTTDSSGSTTVTTPNTTATTTAETAPPISAVDTDSGDTTATTATPTTQAPTTTVSASGVTDGTYTGSSVQTRYGPVQVQITVSGGAIVDVGAVAYPSNDGHSLSINSQAIPVYNSEVLSAQSADISAMSGATVTWSAYVASVDSAISQALA